MYSRNDADGEATTFGVSGKLWNGVLVMYDRATESLWTQLDGRALEGPRAGERLEHVPSTYTTWGAWVAAHPQTLVLEKPEEVRGWEHSHYDDYLADPERLFLPELSEGLGGVGPKDVVFGVRAGGREAALSEDLLQAEAVVNAIVGGLPLAWVRFASTGRVVVVSRRDQDQVLVLQSAGSEGQLRDLVSGRSLHADQLPALRVDRAFWYAWKRTHPGSTILAR